MEPGAWLVGNCTCRCERRRSQMGRGSVRGRETSEDPATGCREGRVTVKSKLG